MKIGVDIGGTNTDAVLVDNNKKIVAAVKETTTQSIEQGVITAISQLLQKEEILPKQVEGIFIGSTHATNAILEEKNLLKVGLIRLAGQRPDLLPGYAWPQSLKSKVIAGFETVSGGYECDGRLLSKFEIQETRGAIERLLNHGVEAISVVGTFSPLNGDQEMEVARLVEEMVGNSFPLTLSSKIGGLGFLERENATILNSALQRVVQSGFQALEVQLRKLGIQAPLYMIHNDGSIMDLEFAIKYPIFTISSGQTNSFRGAVHLAGCQDAVVVDIGGTSSDIGLVTNGFAKRSCHAATIGGVKLHFAMPDVVSLAIGGGTVIRGDTIGPDSVAKGLRHESQCYGGDILTLTDVALKLGLMHIADGDDEKVVLEYSKAFFIMKEITTRLEAAIAIVKGKNRHLPTLAVGGAASLFQNSSIDVDHSNVANALGAVLAEVSSTVDVVTTLDDRKKILDELKEKAIRNAIEKGASLLTTKIVNVEIMPYAYSKEGLNRVVITASGSKGS